ncbi:Uncharacterised protein [Yersinia kristensenii]|nr:Uncharacterised protein [Yersinia kristensenii]CNJ83253.1 Uncharacterised protein [Yersinia kristensenii]
MSLVINLSPLPQPPKGAGAHPCGIPRFARIACPLRGFPHSSFRLTDRRDSLLLKHGSLGFPASRPTFTLHSAAQMCFESQKRKSTAKNDGFDVERNQEYCRQGWRVE